MRHLLRKFFGDILDIPRKKYMTELKLPSQKLSLFFCDHSNQFYFPVTMIASIKFSQDRFYWLKITFLYIISLFIESHFCAIIIKKIFEIFRFLKLYMLNEVSILQVAIWQCRLKILYVPNFYIGAKDLVLKVLLW